MASYYKDENNGKWYVRFRETDFKTGTKSNRKLSGFKTKKEAQYAYDDHIAEYNRLREEWENEKSIPQTKPVANLKFKDLVAMYYAFKKNRIKDASYYDLAKKTDSRIVSFFGEMEVKAITPVTVLDWLETLKDYSYAYKKTLFDYLSSIFKFANRYHGIPNIMTNVDRPRNVQQKKEMLFYTPEEFSEFITRVEKRPYAMFFTFLFLSGCRRGEALALSWEDINLINGAVKINKSVAPKATIKKKGYVITSPKTESSNRTIYLPMFFLKELEKYKEWQAENYEDTSFVFCGERPFPLTNIARELKEAAASANVKRIRVHDFRHSCASLLLHKGTSIVAVSHHLGHKSTKETLDTYAHFLPNDQTIILNNLSEVKSIIPSIYF